MSARCPLLVAALLGAAAGPVAADAAEVGEARLIAPSKRIVVHALLEVSLSADAAFAPVSVAPDVWYGVSPQLTVGLVHSSRATSGFLGGAGDGLCLTGDGGGCGGVYDRAGLVARYHVLGRKVAGGPLAVALDGGLLAPTFDPFALSLKLGVAARWQRGKLGIDFVPNLRVGVSGRDDGNKELLHLPVAVSYTVTPRIAVAAQTGMIAPLEDLRREVVIALSVGAQVLVTDQLFADVVFSLPHWLDTDISTYGLDARTLTLGVGHAF